MTVCNHNRIKCSNLLTKLENCSTTTNSTNTNTTDTACNILAFLSNMACTLPEGKEARKKRSAERNAGKAFCDTCSVPSYLDTEYKFLEKYMTLSKEDRVGIGHSFTDLIQECTFRGRDCLHNR